ncbi:MAG: hypothetical protein P8X39_01690 [Desulfofustis sp.]
MPGSDFGRPKEELSVRIAFVDFNGAEALNNYPDDGIISRTFIGSHCSRTIEAVRRIVDWVCSFS